MCTRDGKCNFHKGWCHAAAGSTNVPVQIRRQGRSVVLVASTNASTSAWIGMVCFVRFLQSTLKSETYYLNFSCPTQTRRNWQVLDGSEEGVRKPVRYSNSCRNLFDVGIFRLLSGTLNVHQRLNQSSACKSFASGTFCSRRDSGTLRRAEQTSQGVLLQVLP